MIKIFKKKSVIWSIVGILLIILVGAFVITDNKNTNKVADNSNKKSANSIAESNSNNSSNTKANDSVKANANNTTSSQVQSESQATTPQQQSKPVQQTQTKPAQTTPKTTDQSSTAASRKYINSKLGLSITFPASWHGKYTIKENSDGLAVIFKPSNNSSQGDRLFTIAKKGPEIENMLDTISGAQRYITAKGVTYVIGGPTDIGFPPDNPEYSTYKQLASECSSVVNTIKSIN